MRPDEKDELDARIAKYEEAQRRKEYLERLLKSLDGGPVGLFPTDNRVKVLDTGAERWEIQAHNEVPGFVRELIEAVKVVVQAKILGAEREMEEA